MNTTPFPIRPVLLVDDEEQFLFSISLVLEAAGINHVVQCQDSRDVMPLLSKEDFSLVLLDMRMPQLSGADLLRMISADFPELPVTVLTAENRAETAVECMKNGAFDYVVKPVDTARLVAAVRRAVEVSDLRPKIVNSRSICVPTAWHSPKRFPRLSPKTR